MATRIGRFAAVAVLGLSLAVSGAVPTAANQSSLASADKQEEKAAKEAQKEAEKAAKEAEKEAEKAAKEAEKEAEKAAKEAEKEAEKAAKEAEKADKKEAKEAAKVAAEAAKEAEKLRLSADRAAARVDAAVEATKLITEQSSTSIRAAINDAQAVAGDEFRTRRDAAKTEYAEAKKEARAQYKVDLELANEAESKEERKRLRAEARERYAAQKRANRSNYQDGLEDARRYRGKAQALFFSPPREIGEFNDPVAVAAISTSGLPVNVGSTTVETCLVEDGFLIPVAPGECVLVASQEGDQTYAAADVEAKVNVLDQPDPQEIELSAPAEIAVGSSVAIEATATSGLLVTLTSRTPEVCSAAALNVVGLTAGSCVLVASQAGDDVWAAAPDVEVEISVVPPIVDEPTEPDQTVP